MNLLVISTNEILRGILKFILESTFVCEAHEVSDKNEALRLLSSKDHKYDFVIYEYDPFAFFLEDIQAQKITTKVMVLVQSENKQNVVQFENNTGIKVIEKDQIPGGIIDYIKSSDVKPVINDAHFCRIAVNLLIRFEGIRKNLYIKIGPDRMVQIMNEEDNTELSDILKYHRKGQDYLYVRRSTAQIITSQVQRQIKVFLEANNFKFFFKTTSDSPESEFEQRIIRNNNEIYIDEEIQKVITDTIHYLRNNIYKEKRIDLFMTQLMNNAEQFSFFTKKVEIVTQFSILLSEKLKWMSKGTVDKIAYAAVLSDITLAVRPKLLRLRDKEAFLAAQDKLSEDDKHYFINHPQECANLANKFFQTTSTDASTLILQHHELPNGKGFPAGLVAEKIYPLSAVFIISHDIAQYILTNEKPSMDEYISENEQRWGYVHFRQAFKALSELRDMKKVK